MNLEATDDVSPIGSPRTASSGSSLRSARGVIEESIEMGSLDAKPDSPGGEEESIQFGSRDAGRRLSDNARRMLANIDKHGSVADDDSSQAAAWSTDAETPPVSPVEASPAAATAAPDTSTADAVAEHLARNERLTTRNRELLAELDTLKAAPRRDMTAREKELDEIERMYADDAVTAIRRLQALALGIADPKSKEVDDELTGLYQDLTERELSVPLDPARKAVREAARTRRMLERDKRDRKAESEVAAKPTVDDGDRRSVEIIEQHTTATKHAEQYPLLMALSADFDGMKPNELLWASIKRGFETGELDRKLSNDQIINTVSKQIETYYQGLADKIGKARPSTATPATQATVATDKKAEPQSTGPRTITNASASVAPATPPAKQPESTDKPKYRNEKARREALAAKHFDS